MQNFLIKILISTLAVLVCAYVLPWAEVDSFWSAVIVALGLAFLNRYVKPLMVLLTIPATILTLGIFLLVINSVIILIVDYFVSGFDVGGFWGALFFSLALSFVSGILESFDKKKDKQKDS